MRKSALSKSAGAQNLSNKHLIKQQSETKYGDTLKLRYIIVTCQQDKWDIVAIVQKYYKVRFTLKQHYLYIVCLLRNNAAEYA